MHKIELRKSPATEEHNLQPEAVILVKSGHLSHLTPIPIRKFITLLILYCNFNKRAFKLVYYSTLRVHSLQGTKNKVLSGVIAFISIGFASCNNLWIYKSNYCTRPPTPKTRVRFWSEARSVTMKPWCEWLHMSFESYTSCLIRLSMQQFSCACTERTLGPWPKRTSATTACYGRLLTFIYLKQSKQ